MKTLPVADCVWEIPTTEKPGMLVPARIYASEALLARMDQGVFEQVTKDPAVVKFNEDAGSTVLQGTVKDKARDFYISEGAKFKLLIEKSGATAE